MKHTMRELVRNNDTRGLFVKGYFERRGLKESTVTSKVCDYKIKDGSFKYTDLDGTEKIAWQMGEKTWFDTKEERDQAREDYAREYEETKYRTKLLARLKELSTEELENLVKGLDK